MKKYVPDILGFSGIALVGYGLHQYEPWTAFVAVGALLIAGAVLVGR